MCATHVPRANLLYSPRNKILATSLLIEAFLYEEQTRRGVSIKHFDEFSDVAHHCTVCHKCLNPCPVDIDFGDVSIAMRNFLRRQGKKKFNPGTATAMAFLNAKDPRTIKLARTLMVSVGYRVQRFAYKTAKALGLIQRGAGAPRDPGQAGPRAQVIHFINKPMPGGLPKRTSRALLDIEDRSIVRVIRDPKKTNEDSDAVFYFPGCGSERLFGQVGLATQAMLFEVGAVTVLPPGYLCCGYPQTAAGEHHKGQEIITDNRVLFHRVANTLNYLDIKTVIVSCGTCLDQLEKYEFGKIFPGCRLLDIHEYLLEKGVKLRRHGTRYMYHDPCHTPIEDLPAEEGGEPAHGRRGGLERPLLRRIGHAGGDPPRRFHPGALSQTGGNAARRGQAARRRIRGQGENPHLLPVLPAGPVALRRRCRHQRRLHRGGNRRARAGADWMPDYVARPTRRHRAGAAVTGEMEMVA